jgi:hypothetical protein
LRVLNVASGYCVPRQRATGRRAYDKITMLVMAIYPSPSVETDYTSVGGMVALHHQKMGDLMGVLKNIPVEVPRKSSLLF